MDNIVYDFRIGGFRQLQPVTDNLEQRIRLAMLAFWYH